MEQHLPDELWDIVWQYDDNDCRLYQMQTVPPVSYLQTLHNARCDLTCHDNAILKAACVCGFLDVVKFLVEKCGANVQCSNSSPLRQASASGYVDIVRYLVSCGADPSANNDEAFIDACMRGNLEVIEYLASQPSVNVIGQDHRGLCAAAEHDYLLIVIYLLSLPEFAPLESVVEKAIYAACKGAALCTMKYLLSLVQYVSLPMATRAIEIAAQSGALEIVKILLEFKYECAADHNVAFINAASNGHVQVAQHLLSLPSVRANDQNNLALRTACNNNHLSMVEFLCSGEESVRFVDVTCCNHEALTSAVRNRNLDMLKLLAKQRQVNINHDECALLRLACTLPNNLEMVRFLATQPDADITVRRNDPLCRACENGDLDLVRYILSFEAVNKYARNGTPLRNAIVYGHLPIVKVLMEEYKVSTDNTSIVEAAANGHMKIIEYLLTYPDVIVNTAVEDNPVFYAACNGHLAALKLLCELKGENHHINLADNDNAIFRHAAGNGRVNVLQYLIDKPGVDPTACDNDAIKSAAQHRHMGAVRYLASLPLVDITVDGGVVLTNMIKTGNFDIIQHLIELPQSRTLLRNNLGSFLHIAAQRGDIVVVKYLLPWTLRYNSGREWVQEALRIASTNGRPKTRECIAKFQTEHFH